MKKSEKVINFKEWLEKKGVDTELFWKNCLPENQKWYAGPCDRETIKGNNPCLWVDSFNWSKSLQENLSSDDWSKLDDEWKILCYKHEVEFGFI